MGEENDLKIIGERLKKARELKGLTKKELAQTVGVAPSTITRYEEEVRIPKVTILRKIAEVLGVSVDYLVGKDEESEEEIATHITIKNISELPEEAKKSVQEFLEYIKKKYGKKI